MTFVRPRASGRSNGRRPAARTTRRGRRRSPIRNSCGNCGGRCAGPGARPPRPGLGGPSPGFGCGVASQPRALSGTRCVPRRLLAGGFEFRHADLGLALRGLLAPGPERTESAFKIGAAGSIFPPCPYSIRAFACHACELRSTIHSLGAHRPGCCCIYHCATTTSACPDGAAAGAAGPRRPRM